MIIAEVSGQWLADLIVMEMVTGLDPNCDWEVTAAVTDGRMVSSGQSWQRAELEPGPGYYSARPAILTGVTGVSVTPAWVQTTDTNFRKGKETNWLVFEAGAQDKASKHAMHDDRLNCRGV